MIATPYSIRISECTHRGTGPLAGANKASQINTSQGHGATHNIGLECRRRMMSSEVQLAVLTPLNTCREAPVNGSLDYTSSCTRTILETEKDMVNVVSSNRSFKKSVS